MDWPIPRWYRVPFEPTPYAALDRWRHAYRVYFYIHYIPLVAGIIWLLVQPIERKAELLTIVRNAVNIQSHTWTSELKYLAIQIGGLVFSLGPLYLLLFGARPILRHRIRRFEGQCLNCRQSVSPTTQTRCQYCGSSLVEQRQYRNVLATQVRLRGFRSLKQSTVESRRAMRRAWFTLPIPIALFAGAICWHEHQLATGAEIHGKPAGMATCLFFGLAGLSLLAPVINAAAGGFSLTRHNLLRLKGHCLECEGRLAEEGAENCNHCGSPLLPQQLYIIEKVRGWHRSAYKRQAMEVAESLGIQSWMTPRVSSETAPRPLESQPRPDPSR